MRMRKGIALLICFLLLTLNLPASAGNSVTLTVSASEQAARFQPQMLGSNVGMWEHGGYYPTPDARLVNVIAEAGLKLLRFPGGSEADTCFFDRTNATEWHQGSGAYTRTLRADFLDAFIGLCNRVGAEPLIIVNARIENAGMAAEIVRYCNIEKGYGVKYFEIGNEPELYSGEYRITAEEYASRFAAYAAAMRAVDPSIQLMGSASSQPIYRESWTGKLMESQGGSLNAATIHWYPMVGEQTSASHPCYPSAEHLLHYSAEAPGYANNEWHQSGAIQYAELFTKNFSNSLTNLRDRYAQGARLGLTELSPVTGGDNGAGLSDTAANALWFADILGRLAMNGMDFVTQFLVQGQQEYAMCDSYSAAVPYQLRPVWYTYVMYHRYFGDLLYQSASSDDQTLTIWASGDSRDSTKLKLMIVNKDDSESADAQVKLNGFTPLCTEGKAYTLTADSLSSKQIAINGVSAGADNSLPAIQPVTVSNVSESFSYRFPAHSVTCIELDGYYGAAPPLDTVEEGIAVHTTTEDFNSFEPGSSAPNGWTGKDLSVEAVTEASHRLMLSCQDNSGAVFTLPDRIYFGREGLDEAVIGGALSTKEQSNYMLYKDKYFKVLDSSGETIACLCINVDGWLQFAVGGQSLASIDDGSRQGICLPAGSEVNFQIHFDLQTRTCRLELKGEQGWYTASYYGSWSPIDRLPVPGTATALGGVRLDYSSGSSVPNTICLDNFIYPVLKDIQPPSWKMGAQLAAEPVTEDTVRLSWPAAADNVAIKTYKIYLDGKLTAEVPPASLEYQLGTLNAGFRYQVGVAAVDRGGNESGTLESSVTMPGGEPVFSISGPIRLSKKDNVVQAAVQIRNPTEEDRLVVMALGVYLGNVMLRVKTDEIKCESGFQGWKTMNLDMSGQSANAVIRGFVFNNLYEIQPMLPSSEKRLGELEQQAE